MQTITKPSLSDQWPEQSEYVGDDVIVRLKSSPGVHLMGDIYRDDLGVDGMTLFRLDSGEIVDADECYWG